MRFSRLCAYDKQCYSAFTIPAPSTSQAADWLQCSQALPNWRAGSEVGGCARARRDKAQVHVLQRRQHGQLAKVRRVRARRPRGGVGLHAQRCELAAVPAQRRYHVRAHLRAVRSVGRWPREPARQPASLASQRQRLPATLAGRLLHARVGLRGRQSILLATFGSVPRLGLALPYPNPTSAPTPTLTHWLTSQPWVPRHPIRATRADTRAASQAGRNPAGPASLAGPGPGEARAPRSAGQGATAAAPPGRARAAAPGAAAPARARPARGSAPGGWRPPRRTPGSRSAGCRTPSPAPRPRPPGAM